MKRTPLVRRTPLRAKSPSADRTARKSRLVAAAPIKVKRKPAPPAIEKRHLARVAAMPCLVTGMRPVQVHHVTGYADRMGRIARTNRCVVPLHFTMHKHEGGPRSVERLGHRGFYEDHGVDLFAVGNRLWQESEVEESGS